MALDVKYFKDGDAYERMMGRWSRLVGEQFLDWLDVPIGQRWLDVGCGNGAFTETLIKHCAPTETVAIDPSDAQLDYAQMREISKQVRYQKADAQDLPFKDATFDAAVMALVISFLPDPAKAISEMTRVVRPGGIVATYMWDGRGENSVPSSPISHATKELGLGTRQALPGQDVSTRSGMQDLWENIGLERVETRQIDIQIAFNNFDDFWDSFTSHPNPTIQYLDGKGPDALSQVRSWLDERLPRDSSGGISYGGYANAVKGYVPDR